MDQTTLDKTASDKVSITFNQLYGGGQGVYGKADHNGVKINNLNETKTIYFQDSQGWENLKLQYHYKNGNNTWTTVVEGISLGNAVDTTPLHYIYKVVIPADADSFTITGVDKEGTTKTTPEIKCEGLAVDNLYTVDRKGNIQHCNYNGQYNTVYFYNNQNWTNVSLYYWYLDSSDATGKTTWDTLEFPGEKMTATLKDGTYDIYKFIVPSYAKGFIISNGTKAGVSGHKQTVDISTLGCAGKIYYIGDVDKGTTYKVGSSTYAEGYKTIYFINNWNWSNPQYSYMGIYRDMKYVKQEGTYKTYSFTIPNFVTEFKVNQQLGEESINIQSSSVTDGKIYWMYFANDQKQLIECRKIYLNPGCWNKDNAKFQAWTWGGKTADEWITFSDDNKDGIFEAYIAVDRTGMKLVRRNPSNANNTGDGVWNAIDNITVSIEDNNLYIVTDWGKGEWSTK